MRQQNMGHPADFFIPVIYTNADTTAENSTQHRRVFTNLDLCNSNINKCYHGIHSTLQYIIINEATLQSHEIFKNNFHIAHHIQIIFKYYSLKSPE